MFYIKEPSSLDVPWILSHCNENTIAVSKDTTRNLKSHHILGVDFLYQSYKKQFKGAILNEEDGLNMHLQVAAFFNAIFNQAEQKFLVLILSPDVKVVNWHYHLVRHGGLKVQVVKPNTCPEDFDQEHGLALILSFSHIKLAEYLIDYNYFSVVIDKFDEIASKLIIRKLCGTFNIGLTQRNFYTLPNQKLQWTMLNWSNPGCVGKLVDFYEIDNDNFANFRDNYRHWWFRLTWNFCESFRKQTEKEKEEYTKSLFKWAEANQLQHSHCTGTKVKKRKNHGKENNDSKKIKQAETVRIINKNDADDKPEKVSVNQNEQDVDVKIEKSDTDSSADTIIYEYDTSAETQKKEQEANYVQLPSMDENPILNSIIRNLETSPEPIASYTKYDLDQPTYSKALDDDDDVLMSIIDDTPSTDRPEPLDHETQMSYKKEELLSQIFSDEPCTSKTIQTEEDSDFFQTLVDTDNDVSLKRREIKKGKCDIEDILKETEILLRE